jgi:hypothetical protein
MISPNSPAPSTDLAPLEIRDAVYSRLIELSPACNYERELVTAPRGLLTRGFSRDDIRRFGALPPRVAERDALARKINTELEVDLPVYAASRDGAAVLGVPGFWEGADGQPKFGRANSYGRPRSSFLIGTTKETSKRARSGSAISVASHLTVGSQPPKTSQRKNRAVPVPAVPSTSPCVKASTCPICRCSLPKER